MQLQRSNATLNANVISNRKCNSKRKCNAKSENEIRVAHRQRQTKYDGIGLSCNGIEPTSLAYPDPPTWQCWIIHREPALEGGCDRQESPQATIGG
jgi:hypothetical protein